MTVDDAAAELYAGAPADFVRRRNELAAQARADGDRDLAAAVAALRKPTTGAWLANLLSLEHRDELEQLVALGEALREAQDVLDPEQLRELGRQRHRVVRKLVTLAAQQAAKDGRVPGRAAEDELEATLTAALSDPAAAEQVLSGRMTHGLTYAGLGFGEAAGAKTTSGRPAPAPRPVRAASAAPDSGTDARAAAHAAKIDAAERDLAQARLQAAAAASDAQVADELHERAQVSLLADREQLERLTAEIAQVEAAVRSGRTEVEAAARAKTASAREATTAARRADRAEQNLEALRAR